MAMTRKGIIIVPIANTIQTNLVPLMACPFRCEP